MRKDDGWVPKYPTVPTSCKKKVRERKEGIRKSRRERESVGKSVAFDLWYAHFS